MQSVDAAGHAVTRTLRGAQGASPPVSVIIPARNEETTMLAAAVDSVLSQDYGGEIEVIVVDGSDTSAMAESIRRRFPQVRMISNPERTTPQGLNRALRAATHSIIVRCDAHSVLHPGYLTRAVERLASTGAANVGGQMNPVGTTAFERTVALATTTILGVGDARYRLGGPEGPTDTVYLGVFRREVLEATGGFDPSLLCNQDYALNWRLRERGETVWFDPALVVDYRPRGTFTALARQYFRYGRWKRVMLRRHPASLRYRQIAAPLLMLGLTMSALLAVAGGTLIGAGAKTTGLALLEAAGGVPLSYLLLLVGGSVGLGVRRRDPHAVLLPLVLATMHLFWGAGFFAGGHTAARAVGTVARGRRL